MDIWVSTVVWGITISYWNSSDAMREWKNQVDHRAAQLLGKERFYNDYHVHIAKVEREYTLKKTTTTDSRERGRIMCRIPIIKVFSIDSITKDERRFVDDIHVADDDDPEEETYVVIYVSSIVVAEISVQCSHLQPPYWSWTCWDSCHVQRI